MRNHFKYLKKEKGMTLIELLAVLVILGIVAAIAVPLIGNIINESKDKAILADAQQIISAAKIAHANGKGDGEGTLTFAADVLRKYVDENAQLADTDAVQFIPGSPGTETTSSTAGKWQIKYKRFNELKTDEYSEGIVKDGYTEESVINNLLQ